MKDVLQPPENFKYLEIPRKNLAQSAGAQYRVYSNAKDFVTVEAENAQAAIAQSGVVNPLRVVRHIPSQCNVLEFPPMDDAAAPVAAPVMAAPSEVPVEEAAPVAAETVAAPEAAPASEAPLSNEDVEKLLQGGGD